MKRSIRLIALSALVALAVIGPGISSAAFPANMPGMTFPAHAGGYNSLTLNATGYGDPLNTVRIHLGTPPCPPAGCGTGPLLASTTIDAFGNWTVPITLPTEGNHRLYVFGNNGLVDSVPLVRDVLIDLTAPAAPVIADPLGGETYTSRVVPFAGTAEPRAMVVLVDEVGLVRRTTADDSGNWTYNALFTYGPHTVSAYQNDLAFNQSPFSPSVSFDVDIDVIAPGAPVITSPGEGELTDATVTVTGTAEPFSTVEILEDRPPGFIIYGSTQTGSDGNWSIDLTFLDSLHVIEARATDAAGNLGPRSAKVSFQVDAIRPVVRVFKSPNFLFAQINLFNSEITGSATDFVGIVSIEVKYIDFLTGAEVQTNPATCEGGCVGQDLRWSDEPSGLAPGLYAVEAYATDQVGNVSVPGETNLIYIF